ncbi:Protein of unknown function [Nitrosovibrio sp. Nv4]|nr:Protein of unknown function [Nitrosovibrio sp. Nv4]SOD41362.1 Protein of unknown function [Nitrosovibrio sp. Nv4]
MANVLTPEFRVSYAHVFKPQKNDLNGNMEYSVVAIFDKGADLSALKSAAEDALMEKFGANKANWPATLKSPFRKCKERWSFKDGKQVIPAGYEDPDAVFMTFKQNADKGKPGLVDNQVQDIIEPQHFYSGCYARASVRAFGYDQKGNRGASFGLGNIQKMREGEPLGGRTAPSQDFTPVGEVKTSAGVFDD